MNLLLLPELFYQISTNLNDKEKIFIVSCSIITYNLKSLIKLDSGYYSEEISNKWCVKNILINEFTLESKKLIKDSIPESIIVKSKYVKFISNNTNIKLFHNKKIIEKIVFHECPYLAMKIMLNNNESIDNINKQFIKASKYGYLHIIKLLINLGADIRAQNNQAIIYASRGGHLPIVKLLIELGADIHAQDNDAIIDASNRGHLDVVKLLIDSGADVHAQNNQAIILASNRGHLSAVKLLIESGANIPAQNNQAIIYASIYGYIDVLKLPRVNGANINA